MMSDFEPNPAKADSVAADDVPETESTSLAGPDEPSERADSISIFPSEGPESEGIDLSSLDSADVTTRAHASQEPNVAGTWNPQSRRWYSVPVVIADDRAKLEATWKLETYVETVATLQAVCTGIEKRLGQVEETLARTEEFVADRTLHELSTRIAARLTETEGAVRRIESLVASGAVAELSARVDAAFAHTDDALRRIEAALESRSDVPSINRGAVAREDPWQVVSTTIERQTQPAGVAASAPPRSSQAPWRLNPSILIRKLPGAERIARLTAVAVVLVGVLIFIAPTRVPINVATPRDPAPPPREEQQPAVPVVEPEPLAQAPEGKPTPPTSPSTQPTTRGASAPAPRRRAAAPTTENATAPPAAPVRFVGDLSITSTPQGARVVVNGRAVGVTPLILREQRAGSVAVQIASEGFERWSASVQIPAGQVTNIVATLRASRR